MGGPSRTATGRPASWVLPATGGSITLPAEERGAFFPPVLLSVPKEEEEMLRLRMFWKHTTGSLIAEWDFQRDGGRDDS